MTKLVDSLNTYSDVLQAKFKAARQSVTDSDVKGGLNEEIISKFIEDTVPHWFIAKNSQIVDSHDAISDEQDICVCNQHQFFVQPQGGLLIAEGVDFVIQVKAKLSDSEISRMVHNCSTVKGLKRMTSNGDIASALPNLPKDWNGYIPYVCVSFSSELSPKTLQERLTAKTIDKKTTQQPDAVFVLDRGITLFNCRDGRGHTWQHNGKQMKGWICIDTSNDTLFEFISFCARNVPRFTRLTSPLNYYIPKNVQYNMIGEISV